MTTVILPTTVDRNETFGFKTLCIRKTSRMDSQRTPIDIEILDEDIAKQNVDVIVNTTSSSLFLNIGFVSSALWRVGGVNLQNECKTKYPSGIATGQIARTSGHGLPCTEVFHVALRNLFTTSPDACRKELREITAMCLEEASKAGYTSIVFPALGTGTLSYPANESARVMLEAIVQFRSKAANQSLSKILIAVYQNQHVSEIFKEELKMQLKTALPLFSSLPRSRLPVNWVAQDTDEFVKLVPLQAGVLEYQQVEENFRRTLGNHQVQIISVERVQNPILYTQYLKKKAQMIERNGPAGVNEMTLWHGTTRGATENINKIGFDPTLCKRAMHGFGTYFAVQSELSTSYSPADFSTVYRHIYQCKVLVGHTTKGVDQMRFLPVRTEHVTYDTATDCTTNPTMYVVFDTTQAYPEFLITFV